MSDPEVITGPKATADLPKGKSSNATTTVIKNTTTPNRPKGVNPSGKGMR